MEKIIKAILTMLAMAAVLGYSFYNYTIGKIDLTSLLVFIVILGVPFMNMVRLLIEEIKNK